MTVGPARLRPLTPSQLTPQQRQVYDDILAARGTVSAAVPLTNEQGGLLGPFDVMVRSATIGDALQRVGTALRADSLLSATATEAVILTVAVHWDSDFEWYAHTAIARAKRCLTEADIERIAAGQRPEESAEAGLAWYTATKTLSGTGLDDEQYQAAITQWSETGLIDLTCLTGYYSTLAMLLGTFHIGPPDSSDPQ